MAIQRITISKIGGATDAEMSDSPANDLRHSDHRVKWTCQEFQTWRKGLGEPVSNFVKFAPRIGKEHVYGEPLAADRSTFLRRVPGHDGGQ